MRSFRHRVEYWAVTLVGVIVRLMPRRSVRPCGMLLGLAFYVCDRAHRRIALANVEAAFPARGPAEHRAIVRGVFAHFGRLLVEFLKFSTLQPSVMLKAVEFEGAE